MKYNIKKFSNQETAVTFVETALVLPILVLLVAGIFELAMYTLLNNKLTRIAGVLTDSITRQNITRQTLTAMMSNMASIAKPFDFNANGRLVTSLVYNSAGNTDTTKMVISWQQNLNNGQSRFGTPGAFPKNLPNNITLINNQSIILTEVFFDYTPLIFKSFVSSQTLYKVSAFVPRIEDMTKLIGE